MAGSPPMVTDQTGISLKGIGILIGFGVLGVGALMAFMDAQIEPVQNDIARNSEHIQKNAEAIKVTADAIEQVKSDQVVVSVAVKENEKDITRNADDVKEVKDKTGLMLIEQRLTQASVQNLDKTLRDYITEQKASGD